MTFAGVLIGSWLAIAGLAFLAISGLGRLAARGDIDADLAIVGNAELRMLVGDRGERSPIELRSAPVKPRSAVLAWPLPGEDDRVGRAVRGGRGQ